MRPWYELSEDQWWTIFGAILAIVGCLFQAVGFIIQKMAHIRLEKLNNDNKKKFESQSNIQINSAYDADAELLSNDGDHAVDDAAHSYDLEMKPQIVVFSASQSQSNRSSCSSSPSSGYKRKSYVSSKLWLLGFFLNGVVGSLLNIIALNYAPQSVVLPLSATTLVGNTILATKILNEPFLMQDFVGVSLVILGSVGTIVVGPKEEHSGAANAANSETFNVSQLKQQWSDSTFLFFFLVVCAVILVDLIILQILNGVNARRKRYLLANGTTEFQGEEIGDFTVIYARAFYLVSYPLIAAFMASINFLVLKSFVQIVSVSIKNRRAANTNFTFYATYVYIAGIFVINFLLEKYRQKGLRAFGAIYVIPIYQVLVITLGTSMGAIYFKEMQNMTVLNFLLFVASVFVTCCGVVILALSNYINKFIVKRRRRRSGGSSACGVEAYTEPETNSKNNCNEYSQFTPCTDISSTRSSASRASSLIQEHLIDAVSDQVCDVNSNDTDKESMARACAVDV
mmetsp:Transcript_29808/g.48525  ORF Transcript_29808/g.48525 Transcript_29808/m.48525 type:complete len:512 (+) Transcript_29808:74-1609(+)|eukprot:CAMPEP_0202697592 /NCGR_PEP_ID=MMETSP1385-20130828/10927_1 /ASSEMBLY_ACC=CAM_ASM_000861 /TAXON_ID=933848 /ORGANISM="Elphidium margaritaceum" /LENGTH=511 /DNA_ID=CAMNT_0049354091 /DNA_START=23 /DNA_END=1558 /DNA_ORIENTATION=+